ncbi:MAG: hypothetical protein NVSMB52_18500 [Chloroflexota bacterium]
MVESDTLTSVVAEPVVLASAIQEAALTVPGVVRISPGRGFVEATYGPGKTVQGIGMGRYDGQLEISVHVVTGWTPIPSLAQRLRRTVASVVSEYTGCSADRIDVYIDDIVFDASRNGDSIA